MPRFLSLLCALALTLSLAAPASATTDDDAPPLQVSVEDGQISWTPSAAYDHVSLVIAGPEGVIARRSFTPAEAPSLDLASLNLPDGEYSYEATISGLDGTDGTVVQSGDFVWLLGALTAPDAAMVFIHVGDGSIDGSVCVGLDCVSTESFGFDTFRLKENNLRLHFDDTSSSASFPSNDWRIQINDSANGGQAYFAVEDATAGTIPFRVRAGAGNHALYVNDAGNVGLGTATPTLELHIADGDSPSMRLEQNGSSGFGSQTWDLAGNETNFFIRDVTNGSALPFRIRPGGPGNAIYIENNGNTGLYNTDPQANLDVNSTLRVRTSADIPLFTTEVTFQEDVLFDRDARVDLDLTVDRDFFAKRFVLFEDNYSSGQNPFIVNDRNNSSDPNDDVELFRVDADGNAFAGGAMVQTSDVNAKQDFLPVNSAQVLSAVREMPLTTWRYRTGNPEVRHLGPMAQDFYAAFGLGFDETTIASVDADGVALASIQALAAENDELRARLAALEALVAELAQNQ
ncbi:MAG: tail fiber domain-containing protein [Bacteroidota bacterium]